MPEEYSGVILMFKLVDKIEVSNTYSGSDWNFESTTKYIFSLDNKMYEVGYFEHYRDGQYIKSVIELPVSYGCPSKCHFCASSSINDFSVLNSTQIKELFDYVYKAENLNNKNYVLVTLTGIGDIYFNFPNVSEFLISLRLYENIYITLSSCLWNKEMLLEVENLSSNINIRNVQITYVSDNNDILSELVPVYLNRKNNLNEVIDFIANSNKNYYRINYILIKGKNDKTEDIIRLKDNISRIKNKVIVRLSKLNETKTTKLHGLKSASLETMKLFNELLSEAGIKNYLFYSCKNDNMNCGQLITERF